MRQLHLSYIDRKLVRKLSSLARLSKMRWIPDHRKVGSSLPTLCICECDIHTDTSRKLLLAAFVSFRQQIVTPHSTLPLAITNPTVIILQHYLDASPTCDEIFRVWQVGDQVSSIIFSTEQPRLTQRVFFQTKNEQQTHAAVELLSEIINILTPLPFFRASVIGLVNKVVAPTEPYHDYVSFMSRIAPSSCMAY